MGFGDWLASMLVQRGMSQKQLAQEIGVTAPAVNGWVNGRSEPRYEKIAAIAEALDVAVEDAIERRPPASMRSELQWIFRAAPDDGGREGGNAAAFAFTANLEVLAREATQNSLDERLSPDGTVTMSFGLHELTGQHLIDFQEALNWDALAEHLRSAADPNQKVGRVLLDGLNDLERTHRLVLLRVDDYNATGLTGPEYADGRFARVVRRTLDSGKAGTQGGSYGLGKAALWSASRFGLVLVNSTLSTPHDGRRERRMTGRIELPWHQLRNEEFAGPGWFGAVDHERENSARSWWGDRDTAERLYLERNDASPGTSFLVVGAYDGEGDAENVEEMHDRLVTALASNFWASMVEGDQEEPLLRASVTCARNGRMVRPEEHIDPHVHEPARSRAVKAFLDGTTVRELTEVDQVLETTVPLKLASRKRASGAGSPAPSVHDAVLLITTTDENDARPDQMAYMRATRMVVRYKRISDLPLGHRPFQAVLLAGAASRRQTPDVAAAEMLLRTAEPPDHNDWVGTEDLTATYARGARQNVLNFKREAEQCVREVLRRPDEESDPDEGPEILRDLLRMDVPKSGRTRGFPTVKSVSGHVTDKGSWSVRVSVKLPQREEPWVLSPVLRFSVRSGAAMPVQWSALVPERNCQLDERGRLVFTEGVRSGVFSGTTDVASHPVAAGLASVEVDVQRSKGGPA